MKNIPFKFTIKDKVWIAPLGLWGEVRQCLIDNHKERSYHVLYYKSHEAKKEWFDEDNLHETEKEKLIGYNIP